MKYSIEFTENKITVKPFAKDFRQLSLAPPLVASEPLKENKYTEITDDTVVNLTDRFPGR